MTVLVEDSNATFTGIVDGVPLTCPFPVEDANHLEVTYGNDTLAAITIDYTVTLFPPLYATAEVVPVAGFAALSGGTINVQRKVPTLQTLDIGPVATIKTSRLEQGLDYLTFITTYLRDVMSRALLFPRTDVAANRGPLPLAADRALKFLAFDADGKPVAATGSTNSGSPGTAFGVAWYALANAAAGMTALGFSAYMAGLKATASLSALQTALGMSTFFKTLLPITTAALFRTAIGVDPLHGNCRLTKSGANLLLSPYNGNKIRCNDSWITVAGGGTVLAPTALAINTTFYIYAFDVGGGVAAIEASTTVPELNALTSIVQKTGNPTRTLVGMARTIAGPAWADTASQRLVSSYFNRRPIVAQGGLTAVRTTASAVYAVIGVSEGVEFLTWAGDGMSVEATGIFKTDTDATTVETSISIDSATVDTYAGFNNPAAALTNAYLPFHSSYAAALAEGHHFADILGRISGGATASFAGGATVGARTMIRAIVQG